ncbi:Eco57I restriction-modification methylase domain-containing protein [Deinococcus marmoris]|uniref:Eco57I restriction-modification methylase domain-containing protein n=1 Tax=Deinococcus marmoris TaxID=249408 RepID=UPI00049525AF|nr:Eco57I restriction-modification methylase domain-containing protein [Deinococcus marmoris]
MTQKVSFTLRGRNPDVLTCIANLSNDEVFTAPEFANQMLDTLAEAWAADHAGASIWADPTVRFLDPCTKTGVFLREITRRLIDGLAEAIPDLGARVDHILTRQIFGIGITQITALLARRSVYCSKHADGEHSVASSFANDAGNIWFERLEHTWEGKKCKYCGAPKEVFDREVRLETHAYAFIHTLNIKFRLNEIFGGDMQFDVIIGNPPYQMKGGGGGNNDSSIYHLFVEQAMQLEPRYLSMVIPSRWIAGGRGMDKFRKTMLTDGHISDLVDYTQMSTAFPGVDFEGGVGYFLWRHGYQGDAHYTLYQGEEKQSTIIRNLGAYDVFIRDHRALEVLEKVQSLNEPTMDAIISADTPFGLATNFPKFKDKPFDGAIMLYRTDKGRRVISHTSRSNIQKNVQLIDVWKVFLPEAYGERGAVPALVLGPSIVAPPASVCTQTYLTGGAFAHQDEANSLKSYAKTKFFRFLVSLRKITQHALRSTYSWVPQQTWNITWTDEMLYQKYGITPEEQAYIESMIRPMDSSND